MYRHHYETSRFLEASPADVFAELDDHERLSVHMMRSSAMMAGASMRLELDAAKGRKTGSKMTLRGRVLGLPLNVEEVVIEYTPPLRKVWETVGTPRLLVIGRYRMGFELAPGDRGSRLTIFIDYDPPVGFWNRIGRLLGPAYARWCTTNMADGVARHFG